MSRTKTFLLVLAVYAVVFVAVARSGTFWILVFAPPQGVILLLIVYYVVRAVVRRMAASPDPSSTGSGASPSQSRRERAKQRRLDKWEQSQQRFMDRYAARTPSDQALAEIRDRTGDPETGAATAMESMLWLAAQRRARQGIGGNTGLAGLYDEVYAEYQAYVHERTDARVHDREPEHPSDKAARPRHSKYDPLTQRLASANGDEVRLTIGEIDALTPGGLPASATHERAWWANTERHAQARSWLRAGWATQAVDLRRRTVTFARSADLADPDPATPQTWTR